MDLFEKLNAIRRRILILSLLLLLFFTSGFVFLAVPLDGSWQIAVSVVSFALALIDLLLISMRVSSYKQLFGRNMMKSVMASVFEEVTYEPERALPASTVENTDMIRMGNRYESGEYRTGLYHGIRFTMADVVLKNILRDGKRTETVTYFSGSWMVFEFPSTFAETLQIKEKSFLNAQKPKGEPDMNRVEIGSERFKRFFKVYAENESAARAFLTPSLEDAVMALNYELFGDLMIYFCQGRLHIALHGKRAQYEPPMLGKLYRDEVERVLLADHAAICAFLDRLLEIDGLFTTSDE